MPYRRVACVLLASASLAACVDDDHPPSPRPLPGNAAHLGALSPAVLGRAFAAAGGQDVTVALFTADLLPQLGGACVATTEQAGQRTLTAHDCTTDAGVTLDGSVTLEGAPEAPTRVTFTALTIGGGPDLTLDGSIATQRIANGDYDRQIDLAVERAGIAIHTVLDYQQRGAQRTVARTSHVELPTGESAAIAWAAGGVVRLVGGDELAFTPDASVGACGAVGYLPEPAPDQVRDPHPEPGPDVVPTARPRICLWTPFARSSLTSARGSLRSIEVCPAAGAPRVVVDTTATDAVTLTLFDLGGYGSRAPRAMVSSSPLAGDPASAVFHLDTVGLAVTCDSNARAWEISQAGHGHDELLTSPPLDYVW